MQMRRKIFLVSILLGCLWFVSPVLAATPKEGALNSRSNLRNSAGFTKILAKLNAKTKVLVVGEVSGWYHVELKDGSRGWIKKELVDLVTVPSVKAEKPTKQKTAILQYASKIRKTPEKVTGNVIEILFPGTKVLITGSKNDWLSIEYGSKKTGWISQALIDPSSTVETFMAIASSSTTIATSSIIRPSFISDKEINEYWQGKVNALRKIKGVREVVVNESLVRTATKWSDYLGQIDSATHVRPDGKSMHQWIDGQSIEFTKRNSANGWKNNYFSENLGYRLGVKPNADSVKAALDSVLQSFLREGVSGVHYKTVYYPDWNSVGVGWLPIKDSKGNYTIYFVFHYGSLVK